MELHGGRVAITSEGTNRGTRCRVSLPLTPGRPVDEIDTTADPHAVAPIRILVVDNNRDAAESLAALLGAWGYDTHTVGDGPSALDLAPRLLPDLILLEVAMPGMDGYEVVRGLKRMPGLEGTVIVAVTGYGRDEDRERALQAGFDRHARKPVDLVWLRALLRTLRPGRHAVDRA